MPIVFYYKRKKVRVQRLFLNFLEIFADSACRLVPWEIGLQRAGGKVGFYRMVSENIRLCLQYFP